MSTYQYQSLWTKLSLSATLFALAVLLAHSEMANAGGIDGAKIKRGDVSFSQDGNTLRVRASNGAIIEYNRFSVEAGQVMQFIQPSATSRVLNRVTGSELSRIDGSLLSNGIVYLVNPQGIRIGNGALINVGGFYAAAGAMSDKDFIRGNNNFTNLSGKVTNEGMIHARSVALVGQYVANRGTIQVDDGVIAMAAGDTVFLQHGTGPIMVTVNRSQLSADGAGAGTEAGVSNTGTINAGKGKVAMSSGDFYALALDLSGTIIGKSIAARGGKDGVVAVNGTLDASSTTGKGGTIDVFGDRVGLFGNALVNANGATGGGSVRIGGDYLGTNAANAPQANRTVIGTDARITANATQSGDGGRVIVWSNEYTGFFGSIDASAVGTGKGGFIETSSHDNLQAFGSVNAKSARGKAGTWLLDPSDVTIAASADDGGSFNSSSPNVFTPTVATATANVATVNSSLNGGTSVTINTGSVDDGLVGAGNITLAAAITKTVGGDATLTLNALGSITLSASITSTVGALSVALNAGTTVAMNSTVTTNGGDVNVNAGGGVVIAGNITAGGTGEINITGNTLGSSIVGVTVNTGKTIQTTNGNLNITGTGGSGSNNFGFYNNGGTIKSVGSGNVFVTGTGGNYSGGFNPGVFNSGIIKSVGSGNVFVMGTGGSGGGSNHGVYTYGTITSDGSGSVTVTGTGGSGGDSNYGVWNNTGTIKSGGSGSVTVTGTGGSGGDNNAIYMSGGSIIAPGALTLISNGGAIKQTSGTITVVGATTITAGTGPTFFDVTLAQATNNFVGAVSVVSANNVSLADANALTLGASTVGNNFTATAGGSVVIAGNITAGGTGAINITGNTLGLSTSVGVTVNGVVTIQTTDGDLNITGTGGSSGNFKSGVENSGTITSGGTGSVTVTGTGGSSGNSNMGVWNTATITSAGTGSVTVTGTGGSSGNGNYGVYSYGTITSAGMGSVTVTGTGGTGTSYNIGVVNAGTIESGGSGLVTVTGTGGAGDDGDNYGVGNYGGIITSGGTGSVTVTGTGGSGDGGQNYGVYNGVFFFYATITSGGGAVTVTGTGGTGGFGNDAILIESSFITAPGDLTLTSLGGAINQTGGTITVVGTTTITAGANDVMLAQSTNDFGGAVIVVSANNVSLTDANALTLGASNISGNLAVTAAGGINQTSDAILVDGATTLTASAANTDISLASGENNFAGTVTIDITAGTASNVRDFMLRNVNAAPGVVVNLTNATNLRDFTIIYDNAGYTVPELTMASLRNVNITTGAGVVIAGDVTAGNDGEINITGNTLGSSTSGVIVNTGKTIQTTNGNLNITGTGGSGANSSNYGVYNNGGTITSGGAGNVTVTGTGGSGANGSNYGVDNIGTITSGGAGNVTVTGTGGSGDGGQNIGVYNNGGTITSGGAGTVIVTGTGGSGADGYNHGVHNWESEITSGGGSVTVEGTGGSGDGGNNYGVYNKKFARGSSGIITSGGGDVFVTGTGGSGGLNNYAIYMYSASPLGFITAPVNLALTSLGGAINQEGGTITVVGTTTITAGANDVTLAQSTNDFGGAVIVVSADNVSLADANALILGASMVANNFTATAKGGVVIADNVTAGSIDIFGNTNVVVANRSIVGVTVNSGKTIQTTNGDLNITGTGGADAVGFNHGVYNNGGIIQSGGAGNVSVTGTGGDSDGIRNYGVLNDNDALITSGGGTVLVTGRGGNGAGEFNHGVRNDNGSIITSGVSGTVTVIGFGGNGVLANNSGVVNADLAIITSGGLGNVTVTGTGGIGYGEIVPSYAYNVGVFNLVGTITSGGGDVTVTGNGGTGHDGFNTGVYNDTNSIITSGVNGNVSVIGFGGLGIPGDGNRGWNIGVYIYADSQITSSGSGTVTVTGTGGSGDEHYNSGVLLDGANSTIKSGGGGKVTVTGTGGSGAAGFNYGVDNYYGTITSGGGDVEVTGTGGSGDGGFNFGVLNEVATITSGGGNVEVTGTGGTGGSDNAAILMGLDSVVDAPGDLTLTSLGGAINQIGGTITVAGTTTINAGVNDVTLAQSTNDFGGAVSVVSANSVSLADANALTLGLSTVANDFTATAMGGVVVAGNVSAGGTGEINITGNTNVDPNLRSAIGVVVNTGKTIQSTNGNLNITGTGGSNPADNYGVANSGTITSIGAGNVSVTGTGGIGVNGLNIGVHNYNGTITSGGGNVNVTGTGGLNSRGWGIYNSGGTITSGGAGNVTVMGTGANGDDSVGVYNLSNIISSGGSGSVTVTGIGGSGSRSSSQGIINNGTITSGTGGNVFLTGTGGSGAAGTNYGVTSFGTITAGVSGNVEVTGTGGTGGSDNHAILMNTGSITAPRALTLISNGGAINQIGGTITVVGTTTINAGVNDVTLAQSTNDFGGAVSVVSANSVSLADANALTLGLSTVANNFTATAMGGVVVAGNVSAGSIDIFGNTARLNDVGVKVNAGGTIIQTTNGNLNITGTGGSGLNNYGVFNSGTIKSLGAGNVTVTGTGGSGDDGFNLGVYNLDTIKSFGAGSVTVTGIGGTGDGGFNYGVFNPGTITSGGSVTVTGTGGSGAAGSNYGVYNFYGTITSGGGNIELMGTGGSGDSNDAIYMDGGSITAPGDLALTSLGGAINQTGGTILVDATTTITASVMNTNISLAGGENNFAGTLTIDNTAGAASNVRDFMLRNINSAPGIVVNLNNATNLRDFTIIYNNAGYTVPELTMATLHNVKIETGAGVVIANNVTAGTDGEINITGNTNQALRSQYGVTVNGGVTIQTTNGNLNITGEGGSDAGGDNYGVYNNGGTITSGGGNIELTGTGGSGDSNDAIYMDGGFITAPGALTLTSNGGAINQIGGTISAVGATTITANAVDTDISLAGGLNNFAGTVTIDNTGGAASNVRDFKLRNVSTAAAFQIANLNFATNLHDFTVVYDNAFFGLPSLPSLSLHNVNIVAAGISTIIDTPLTTHNGGTVMMNSTREVAIAPGADIFADGAVQIIGTDGIFIAGNVTTTGDSVTFHSETSMTDGYSVIIDTTNSGLSAGADIFFGAAVKVGMNNSQALNLNAGTDGEIILIGDVGSLALRLSNLTLVANDSILPANIYVGGNTTAGNVTIIHDTIIDSSESLAIGSIDGSFFALNITTRNLALNAPVTNITTLTIQNADPNGAITLMGPGGLSIDQTEWAYIDAGVNVVLGGSNYAGTVTVDGDWTNDKAVTIDFILGSAGHFTVAAPITGSGSLTINGSGNTTTLAADIMQAAIHIADAVEVDAQLVTLSATAGDITIDGTIVGVIGGESLSLAATGDITLGGDIGNSVGHKLTEFQVDCGNDVGDTITFTENVQVVAAEIVALNCSEVCIDTGPGSREMDNATSTLDAPATMATIVALGDIEFNADNFRFGQNHKLTGFGDITIGGFAAPNSLSATFGDVNAVGDLRVNANSITLLGRDGGPIVTNTGGVVNDASVDYVVGGRVYFSEAPIMGGTNPGNRAMFSNPTGNVDALGTLGAYAVTTYPSAITSGLLTGVGGEALDLSATSGSILFYGNPATIIPQMMSNLPPIGLIGSGETLNDDEEKDAQKSEGKSDDSQTPATTQAEKTERDVPVNVNAVAVPVALR